MMFSSAAHPAGADDAAAAAGPAASWNATAAIATRYVSRGLDLTNGPWVPSASAEWRCRGGWYLDADATKVNYFGNEFEADGNAGFRGVAGSLNFDLGVYEYYFPGTIGEKVRTKEAGLRLSWGTGRIVPVLELFHSPNYFFGSGRSLYADVGADLHLPRAFAVSGRYGYTHVENLTAFAYPNYRNWLLTATRSFGAWDLALQLTDTSMNRTECLDDNRCSLKYTLRLTRNFGS
jgi:uncharacterized protein (TIGR02001 family)